MPRNPSPENETHGDRFRRLATRRAIEVVRRIRVLRHCSNRAIYDYTPEQVKKMFDLIEEEVKQAKESFSRDKKMPDIQL
jgi:hypothetical protein